MRRRKPPRRSDDYRHPESEALLRPDWAVTRLATDHRDGADVPAWILDTDYNGLAAGTHEQVAVKVIDDRGNALLVVLKHLAEADT